MLEELLEFIRYFIDFEFSAYYKKEVYHLEAYDEGVITYEPSKYYSESI